MEQNDNHARRKKGGLVTMPSIFGKLQNINSSVSIIRMENLASSSSWYSYILNQIVTTLDLLDLFCCS